MATSRIHSHECRECGYDIECQGIATSSGYSCPWNGGNDGCPNCGPDRHSRECDSEYRCWECYPGAVPERPIREHDWYEEAAELRASERDYYEPDEHGAPDSLYFGTD